MKRVPYSFRSTPVVASICSIAGVVLWYLSLMTDNGEWVVEMTSFTVQGMSLFSVVAQGLSLLTPVAFFIATLFLAEKSPRWVMVALLVPVALQLANFIRFMGDPEILLSNPMQYIPPFLAVFLYAFTVEGLLPNKWVLVAFCAVAALLPPLLTLLGIGEFSWSVSVFDYNFYQYVDHVFKDWSSALSLTLYYIGLGSFALQLTRKPRDPEPVPAEQTPEQAPEV